MKKHKKLIIISLIVIVLIVVIVAIFIIKNKKTTPSEDDIKNMPQLMMEDLDENVIQNMGNGREISSEGMKNKTNKQQIKSTTILKTTTEITSALTENVELHATYYLEEVYVQENQFVASGENILKYTNGTYLVAPYDCYIIELNLPDLEDKVLNSHYVEISSSNSLMVIMSVDESNINDVSVGLETTIEVTALGKTYSGNVTHVASTGNNGKFEIEIEFENDGDVMLGMTGIVSITI